MAIINIIQNPWMEEGVLLHLWMQEGVLLHPFRRVIDRCYLLYLLLHNLQLLLLKQVYFFLLNNVDHKVGLFLIILFLYILKLFLQISPKSHLFFTFLNYMIVIMGDGKNLQMEVFISIHIFFHPISIYYENKDAKRDNKLIHQFLIKQHNYPKPIYHFYLISF